MSLLPTQTQLEQDEETAKQAIMVAAEAFNHAAAVLNNVDARIASMGVERALNLLNSNKELGLARVTMLGQAGAALNALRAASGLPANNPAPEALSLPIEWDADANQFVDTTPPAED